MDNAKSKTEKKSKNNLSGSIFAFTKRIKISRAQRMTLLEVLIASLIIGASVVLAIFLGKYINLNMKVITAKQNSIDHYSNTIRNVGICKTTTKKGELSDSEIKNCNPNSIQLNEVADSLQGQVMLKTANDQNLASVARTELSSKCRDGNGKTIDYLKQYQEAGDDDAKKREALELTKTCSSLRVIPDALPANSNMEATMASLNWLLNQAGTSPQALAPGDQKSSSSSSSSGTTNTSSEVVPVSFAAETDSQQIYKTLTTIERSIRTFDPTVLTLEWSKSEKLTFAMKANAYYLGARGIKEQEQYITVNSNVQREGN